MERRDGGEEVFLPLNSFYVKDDEMLRWREEEIQGIFQSVKAVNRAFR